MISEEYFEVGVVHAMDSHVYGMIFCAGIGGIFDLVELDVCEIFNDFDLLDFPILPHDAVNEGFIHF